MNCHELSLAVDGDYSKLYDLLAAGRCKEADLEALAVMVQVAGREKAVLVTVEDIERFP